MRSSRHPGAGTNTNQGAALAGQANRAGLHDSKAARRTQRNDNSEIRSRTASSLLAPMSFFFPPRPAHFTAHTGAVTGTLQQGHRASKKCHLAMFIAPKILGCLAPIEVTGVRVGLYGTDRGFAMASDRVHVDNDSGGGIHAGLRGTMRGSWHAAGCRLSAFK